MPEGLFRMPTPTDAAPHTTAVLPPLVAVPAVRAGFDARAAVATVVPVGRGIPADAPGPAGLPGLAIPDTLMEDAGPF